MNKMSKAEEYLKKQFGEDWEHLSLSAESVKKLLIDFAEINAHDNKSAPVDDVVEMAKKYSERYDDEEDSDNCKSVSTAAYEAGHASRQPEIDALQKRVEELEGKYESDKDNDYEETLPEFCSNCGAEYDEIDYEYQICHLCGCGQTTTEKTNNH